MSKAKDIATMPRGYRPEIIQDAFVDFISTRLNPFWSLTVPKLRLVARYTLSDDLIALQFETNRAFKQQVFDVNNGWHGGQHINISIVIDGIYHQRSYSLVGLPQQSLWWNNENSPEKNTPHYKKKSPHYTVTIAIKPQGLVSNYLTQSAPLGTIFDSSVPSGDFTLAQADLVKEKVAATQASLPVNSKKPTLLFIAGGSGITPMLGLITQALQYGYPVALLHYNRIALFQSHWQQLAATYPTFTYHLINTEDSSTYLAGTRHLSAASLLTLDLPLADTQIFACGSRALLAGLYRAASEITLPIADVTTDKRSLRDTIIIENFGNAIPNFANDSNHDEAANTQAQTVYLRGRQRQFTSNSTLLIGAEQAGIRLTYGCRQGICHMCRCNKVRGVVKNVQTGKISSDGYESIQTCINVAITDVTLDI